MAAAEAVRRRRQIGITGGSYGGYTTCLALTYGADYFTHGIAGSSVTDWKLYDSVYTERYMDTPAENKEGYEFGSVMTHAKNLRGVLLLLHGDMDDNVHMQNTIQLIDALMDEDKLFEYMVFPEPKTRVWRQEAGERQPARTVDFWFKHLLGRRDDRTGRRSLRTLTACPACAGGGHPRLSEGNLFRTLDPGRDQDHRQPVRQDLGPQHLRRLRASFSPTPARPRRIWHLSTARWKILFMKTRRPGGPGISCASCAGSRSSVPERGPLFDVGAATGILLDLARAPRLGAGRHRAQLLGGESGRGQVRLHALEGALETASLPEDRYAAVTMVDFIEHTPLPYEALRRASRILRPPGSSSSSPRTSTAPAARLAGRRWWHLRPAHLAFFSRRSLAVLLRRAGFSIVAERRYSWTFSLHYLLSRKPAFRPFEKNQARLLF